MKFSFLKRNQVTLTPSSEKGSSKIKQFFGSRRAKYGSVAVVFTVVVLFAALLFNVLLSAISANSPMTIDFSADDAFTLSAESKELVSQAMPEDKPEIRIRFMLEKDKLAANEYYNMVMECARTYEENFENITVEYIDSVRMPGEIAVYEDRGFPVGSGEAYRFVIVDSPTHTKDIRMFDILECFQAREGSDTYYAFTGEIQITAAILALCRENTPVVTFTQGHGESVLPQLEEMFSLAGYRVESKNLAMEAMSPETEIVVVSNPQSDFLGRSAAGAVNEIDILNDYLNSHRDMMVFLSPTTPELPEFDALLADRGVAVERNRPLEDPASCLAGAPAQIVAGYAGLGYGSSLHQSASDLEKPMMTIVSNSAPVKILSQATSFDESNLVVDPVLQTSEKATYLNEDNEEVEGQYCLMALSSQEAVVGDDYVYSHLLVCGSASFSEDVPAGDGRYANSRILYAAMTQMAKASAPEGVNIKKLDQTVLLVEEAVAKRTLILCVATIPTLVILLGTTVYLRRKHR